MRRRNKAGGKAAKTKRRRAIEPRATAKVTHQRKFSSVDTAKRIALLEHRLNEALDQQAATSEVLRVISRSPGELQPVFDSILANATRICEAKFGTLYLREADGLRTVATHNAPVAYAEDRKRNLVRPPPDSALGQVLKTHQVTQVVDITAVKSYVEGDPYLVGAVKLGGYRTIVAVPMLKDDLLIGAITINRQEVRPFTEKQIELVQNFAAQAVIAIENTQLLNELRESLQQQTATADVLKVISRSTFDLQIVLDTLAQSAVKLCEADQAVIRRRVGETYPIAATYGFSQQQREHLERYPPKAGRGSVFGRTIMEGRSVHVPDVAADPEWERPEQPTVTGIRAAVGVPLLREGVIVGVLVVIRTEPRAFSQKQIELLETFADQAVIAIENVRLINETQEALEQQTATSEVLKVISSSPGELGQVFEAMLANATRICEAKFGVLQLCEGDGFRAVALHDVPPAYAERRRNSVLRPGPEHPLGRVVRTKQIIHVADILAEPEDARGGLAAQAGARTILNVPMLKENQLIGVISIYRQEVLPFTHKQIELVKNFAAQAVIAIENTRLLNELRQRTDDLTESLEQQTATAEILQTINRSPGDVAPVFDAMVESAMHFCQADYGHVYSYDGEFFHLIAAHGEPRYLDWIKQTGPRLPENSLTLERVISGAPFVHIADIAEDDTYRSGNPRAKTIVDKFDIHTLLTVALRKEDKILGSFVLYRRVARPFSEKQVALVQNFATQAVIAMENARLLTELRQRTNDLSESLQQQTATSDVLKVISRSTFDLQVVLDTLVESAVRLCEAERGLVFRREGEIYKSVAYYNYSPEFRAFHESHPIAPGRGTAVGRTALEGKSVQIADILTDPEYTFGEAQKLGGGRATLAVPLLREGTPIGALSLQRTEPRPYSQKQIELVETFADQAVIAIENVRLFDEVQTRTRDLADSLQQQTATADVLKTISRSTFDLPTVLDALIETAARMSDADQGAITREIDGAFFRAASYGYSTAFADFIRNTPVQIDRGSTVGRALVESRIVHIADVKADADFTFSPALDSGDFRTALGVPMLREGVPIGVLSLTRKDVRPFTDQQIELVTTFADQAAIAIENVRLFESVEARTRDLAASLEDLRNTQDRLVQTQKLASLGQLTAGIAHEIKNPLNFVNNFSAVSSELIDELQDTLKGPLNEKVRADVKELAETLRGNLDKIVQHGKRADAIVKNMLLHSREGSSEHRLVDINALVEESLNLAYHGARAEKQGFNITLERSFDPTAEQADVFPQDITRVLLNLILNGFYAATKRKTEAGDGYEPTLTASTRSLGDRVEIKVRDNGTGIPPDVKEKIFNPFFTTKPAGEGTGLGLSISHDIIVKQHGGSIEVETEPGEYTEFRIILPRAAAFATTSEAQS